MNSHHLRLLWDRAVCRYHESDIFLDMLDLCKMNKESQRTAEQSHDLVKHIRDRNHMLEDKVNSLDQAVFDLQADVREAAGLRKELVRRENQLGQLTCWLLMQVRWNELLLNKSSRRCTKWMKRYIMNNFLSWDWESFWVLHLYLLAHNLFLLGRKLVDWFAWQLTQLHKVMLKVCAQSQTPSLPQRCRCG